MEEDQGEALVREGSAIQPESIMLVGTLEKILTEQASSTKRRSSPTASIVAAALPAKVKRPRAGGLCSPAWWRSARRQMGAQVT
jgi:hypothetical protein